MPEGHSLAILARKWARLEGQALKFSSPQGRFEEEAATLTGKTLLEASSHGKHLFLEFEDEYFVHVHLGLYGKMRWHRGEVQPPKGAVRLRVEGEGLTGDLIGPTRCELLTREEADAVHARLGPDPLREEDSLEESLEWLSKAKWPVGKFLMEQAKIAGIGNVYRAEILFMLALDPWRPCSDLSEDEWGEVWDLARALLQKGVEQGRIITTGKDLPPPATLPPGTKCASRTYVYKRSGKPCLACGTEIKSEEFFSRTLYWCPTCQAPRV